MCVYTQNSRVGGDLGRGEGRGGDIKGVNLGSIIL